MVDCGERDRAEGACAVNYLVLGSGLELGVVCLLNGLFVSLSLHQCLGRQIIVCRRRRGKECEGLLHSICPFLAIFL